MFGEQFILHNKKNNNIRNVLLLFTIVFFIVFIIVFVSSFRKYKNIQERIQHLYETTDSSNDEFVQILTTYNEAEHYFRLFTIDFTPSNYQSYENKLQELHLALDSLIKNYDNENANNFGFISDINTRKRLSSEFSNMKSQIQHLIDSAISLPFSFNDTSDPQIEIFPEQKKSEISSRTSVNANYVVIDRKPFIKRLFGKKKDTIHVKEIERINSEKQLLQKNYDKDVDKINASTQQHVQKIKSSYEKTRQKELQLLSINFKLLTKINELITNIQNLKTNAKNESTALEVTSLFEKSNAFRWQITLCLLFMFSMICIIVYYQFFTNYYEKKLIDERIYASKLAKEKTDILAEITHEIRTPINSLIGIIDLLRKKDHLYDQKEIVLLDSIYSNINNTSKTINDILNLSKIDQNDSSTFVDFNMNNMMEDIVEMHQNDAQLKNIQIKYTPLPLEQCVIHSDDFKIRQIITNLISNSIKYSDKGTVFITTHIDDQSNLIIKVKDEGIGIPEALHENIYRKYYTVNKALKLDAGVGLGLFITKKLIVSLNGKISFTSKKDNGTEFKVEIPIPKSQLVSAPPTKTHSIEDFPKDISWLIVDDNALNLLYMKQFFEKSLHLQAAANGHQAFTIIQQNKIDVVITDINMPIMSGDQLLAQIRSRSELNHIVVIATSSDNEQVKVLEKLHQLKFDGILIKPFNEKKLIETIDFTLRKIKTKDISSYTN